MQQPGDDEAQRYHSFALVSLRSEWGETYDIGWDGTYVAVRRANGDVLSAHTGVELQAAMIADCLASPHHPERDG